MVYKVDNVYSREHEVGLLWSDKDINISWPTKTPTLSEKDKNNISLKEYILKFYSGCKPERSKLGTPSLGRLKA